MIYIENLEQIANTLSDVSYKGCKVLCADIEIPYNEWNEFEDNARRFYPPNDLKKVKETFTLEQGLRRSHLKIQIGGIILNCFREPSDVRHFEYYRPMRGTDKY